MNVWGIMVSLVLDDGLSVLNLGLDRLFRCRRLLDCWWNSLSDSPRWLKWASKDTDITRVECAIRPAGSSRHRRVHAGKRKKHNSNGIKMFLTLSLVCETNWNIGINHKITRFLILLCSTTPISLTEVPNENLARVEPMLVIQYLIIIKQCYEQFKKHTINQFWNMYTW